MYGKQLVTACGREKQKMIAKMPKNFKIYKKKPVEIKAVQMGKGFEVKTLEGVLKGKAGDYLIEGVRENCILAIKKFSRRLMKKFLNNRMEDKMSKCQNVFVISVTLR